MGMFTKGQQNMAEAIIQNAMQYLVQRDGLVHVLMVRSFSSLTGNQAFCVEDKFTTEINTILQTMQSMGI